MLMPSFVKIKLNEIILEQKKASGINPRLKFVIVLSFILTHFLF